MTVLAFPTPNDPDDELDDDRPELEPEPSALRVWLEERAVLPAPCRVAASARWWSTVGLARLGALALKAPYLLLRELRPIGRGLGRVAGGWANWCGVAESREAVAAAEGSDKAKADERYQTRKSARRRFTCAVVVVLGGGGTWAYLVYPAYLAVAGILLVGVLDAVGRHNAPDSPTAPAPHRLILRDGVPLTQITAALVETALREALEFGVAAPMRYDAGRREYRIAVSCLDAITADHLRALERGIGAAPYSMRALVTDVATIRELVIRDGDPLAVLTDRPFLPTGSVSLSDPLKLGVSMTDIPFALSFTQHIRVVAGTGGGKTKWFLRACIDAVSACRDAVVLGIDITCGPELPMWRKVIQRVAYTPEDAAALLAVILAEIARRASILTAIAEDDDPDNDADEWHPGLGPFWVVFLDEYPQLAAYDGKGGKVDLLGPCEQIIRTARKHGIFLVMFAQKTGNADFGSSVMSSQCGATILGPCDQPDTVRMVGPERRDGGYTPHLLNRGVTGDPRDAGKCFLDTPHHTTPDLYRAYAPGSNSEVKRRARQRLDDGLPRFDGGPVEEPQDVAEVPPILAAVEGVFADSGDPEWMATVDLLPLVRAAGFPELTENELAAGIPVDKNQPGSRKRRPGETRVSRGYLLASIREAMEQL
jgi:hypothetical protein